MFGTTDDYTAEKQPTNTFDEVHIQEITPLLDGRPTFYCL